MEEKKRIALTIVTNSELQTFRDCPKKWSYAYAEALRPMATSKALSFGSAFHAGTEALYRAIGTMPSDEVEGFASEAGRKAIGTRLAQWVAECEATPGVSVETLYADAAEAVATASWMFDHYVQTFRADIARLVPLGVELPFSVELRDRRGQRMPHMRHAGVLDLVAYDPEYGDIVLYDHKTTSTAISAIDRRVELDPQMGGYLNALVETLRHDPGLLLSGARARPHHPRQAEAIDALTTKLEQTTVGRVSYNIVRKKTPSVPKVNKDGTVSVAAIDTLPEFYEKALADQVERGKPIEEKQAELLRTIQGKGDSFIGRREFFRSGRDLESWRAETFEQARLVRAAERDVARRYRNAGHCSMPWSMPCSYRSICLDDSPEIRSMFVEVPRHNEVDEARKRAQAENEED